jgi:hypothetical protein
MGEMGMEHPWRGGLEPEACDRHPVMRCLAQNQMDAIDILTARIIHCIIRVHQRLGPGFRESVYRNAMKIELASCGLVTEGRSPS